MNKERLTSNVATKDNQSFEEFQLELVGSKPFKNKAKASQISNKDKYLVYEQREYDKKQEINHIKIPKYNKLIESIGYG